MTDDDKVVLMGEDIGKLGGVYRVTDGLQTEFGAARVMDTPLAESGIIGTAIGMAYRGYRPVLRDPVRRVRVPGVRPDRRRSSRRCTPARAAWCKLPLTIRIPVGGGIGAAEHHSESPEAYFAHTAGLRVVSVSNPQDACTMLRQAIASDDPVIFFEPKRRYHVKGEVDDAVDLATGDAARVARAWRTRAPATDRR